MRNWRVLTAAVAAVAAVLAAVGVYFYLNKADQRAQSKLAQVSVLVASQPIPAGTPAATAVQRGWLTTKHVARKDVPPGTLTTTDGLGSLVAAYSIDNGGYITPGSFVASAQVNSVADTLQKGDEAIALRVDEQHGIAGFVAPGDRVSMIVSLRTGDKNDQTATAYLLAGLKVLGVGTTSVANTKSAAQPAANGATSTTLPAATGDKGLITVEVTPRQAEQIAQAYALDGIVYLTLDAPHFDPKSFKTPVEIVGIGNLFDQQLTQLNTSTTTKSGK